MNVTELARRLKMNTKELLEKLPELGFDIGKRAIKVDDRLVDKIVMLVEEDRRKRKIELRDKKVREIRLGDNDNLKNLAEPAKERKGEVKIPEVVIVKDFAERLKLPVAKVMAELMKNGIMSTLNERIDFETASIIGEDLGYKVIKLSQEEQWEQTEEKQSIKELLNGEAGEDLIPRPPVVVVMGHVDHGKTKLLDVIRQTNVAGGESGGITQHIGAYQVEEKGKKITFLDTPGHEAFKSMRARGSKIADVAIIVVAADEGLKPQTLEVINLIQKEKIPFVMAINKIDKEGADIDRVKKELAEINLIPEDWGGKTICVPISAKQKKNIPELLDTVLLVAEMEGFKTNPHRLAVGTVIESHLDKGEGPVATILVQSGTLKRGDAIIVGRVFGKIKAMKDYLGRELSEAGPSTPVKLLGLKQLPEVGEIMEVTADKKRLKDALRLSRNQRPILPIEKASHILTKAETEENNEKLTLVIILKTDVLGSQEAIMEAFAKFKDPEVRLQVIKKGLGYVTDAEVLDAETGRAVILAFRVKTLPSAEELARDKKVEILYFDIIYKLLDEIKERLIKLLAPETIRTELGKIQVLAIFKTNKNEMIVGGKVLEGRVKKGTKIKVIRNGQLAAQGDLASLQAGKMDVIEAVKGEECGLLFKGPAMIEVNDLLEIFQEEVKARELGIN